MGSSPQYTPYGQPLAKRTSLTYQAQMGRKFVVAKDSCRMSAMTSCVMIAFVLVACHRGSHNESDQASQQAALNYANACARCHGSIGPSGTPEHRKSFARDLTDEAFQATRSDEQIRQTIMQGSGSMPAFGDEFSRSELDGLVKFVRGLRRKATPESN